MARYIICPRCELNFIYADEAEYCEVCLKEMSGEKTFADDFDAEENMEETELCPICGENYMVLGEKMCEECKKKAAYEDEADVEDDEKEDASWRSYLDDEEEELDLGIPDSEFEDEEEEEEEEEEETVEEEDFEYVSLDDYNGFDDEDDEDDEDDDDDF
jgi:predicted amidophosphoribosyltransferase